MTGLQGKVAIVTGAASGFGAEMARRFVHEGAKVRMGRRSEEWIEIVLEDGTVGWVATQQLEPI